MISSLTSREFLLKIWGRSEIGTHGPANPFAISGRHAVTIINFPLTCASTWDMKREDCPFGARYGRWQMPDWRKTLDAEATTMDGGEFYACH
jgi:hypothetical protein